MANLDLMGTAEAADVLGVSRETLLRWAAEEPPRLPSQKMPGLTGTRVFDPADVHALKTRIAAGRDKAPAAP
ncbi:MAG TPA: helix-turn-helix domain-containing protein [Streptosporangiaceae bacterium]